MLCEAVSFLLINCGSRLELGSFAPAELALPGRGAFCSCAAGLGKLVRFRGACLLRLRGRSLRSLDGRMRPSLHGPCLFWVLRLFRLLCGRRLLWTRLLLVGLRGPALLRLRLPFPGTKRIY